MNIMNPSQMVNVSPQMVQAQQQMMLQAQQQGPGGPGHGIMNPGMVPGPPQNMPQGQPMQEQQQQQQQPPPQQQQQLEQKQDNISRVRNYYWQMKEALMDTLGCASSNVNMNSQIDQGSRHAGEGHHAKFEESLEKFYAYCDQIELNLITAIDCQLQAKASQMYSPNSISPPPVDSQKYAHYLSMVKSQVVYAKDVHSALVDAATSMSSIGTVTSMENPN